MKNLFANLVLFAALSVAFSSLTACSTASTQQKGSDSQTASNDSNAAPIPETGKNSVYPPAPVGIMQSEIKDLDGKTFKIEDKKGKVVLINLWATWCGPCRSEMPHLIEMQEKYKDKNFEILGLNADDEPVEAVKAFTEQMKLNYFVGYADGKMVSEITKLSRQQGIPQSVLINREGKTVGVFFGSGARAINNMKESVEKTVSE
jgi:thiol-disulfide isomerase/thioredoxin